MAAAWKSVRLNALLRGKPVEECPSYYIDPDSCIDCGACVPECPYEAIFMEDEVPSAYEAYGDERMSMPAGTEGYTEEFESEDVNGVTWVLKSTRVLDEGEVVDLTPAIQNQSGFLLQGPGYEALD